MSIIIILSSYRVIQIWNSLPDSVNNMSTFKNKLDKHWVNHQSFIRSLSSTWPLSRVAAMPTDPACARCFAVTKPRCSGHRSFLMVLSQDCLGRPILQFSSSVLQFSTHQWAWSFTAGVPCLSQTVRVTHHLVRKV